MRFNDRIEHYFVSQTIKIRNNFDDNDVRFFLLRILRSFLPKNCSLKSISRWDLTQLFIHNDHQLENAIEREAPRIQYRNHENKVGIARQNLPILILTLSVVFTYVLVLRSWCWWWWWWSAIGAYDRFCFGVRLELDVGLRLVFIVWFVFSNQRHLRS